ncbi:Flp pilus assembly protein TadG [Roseivivax marinus]|uniref:pilus assembly protein TadG-related protein n=1 Tax=Roseivivax marinus TaxID=1379903 RepID=UPI0008B7855B|nr:pilus assembly protein TadG-related protein [Roseivivax marinus]SEL07764.1 Flp pilus assembly protein TadG [Roseivivax marinus]
MPAPRSPRPARLVRQEDGYGTIMSLSVLTITLLMGGFAIDLSNAWRVREVLTSAAEAAAFSGAVRASEPRLSETPEQAAARIGRDALSFADLEDAWQSDSFELGQVTEAGVFDAGATPPDAVRVRLYRRAERGNAEPLRFLFPFGADPWSITGEAVAGFRTRPSVSCVDPLLSLQARVDVSSKNVFAGICLHANATVDYGDAPVWKTRSASRLLNTVVANAVSGDALDADLFGLQDGLTLWHLYQAVQSATQNIHASNLDDIRVLSNGSFRVNCDDRGIARLDDGFVVQNAAIYSDCPIRFGTDVQLHASLVVSNVSSLLVGLGDVEVTPDALLPGSPPCMAGDGVRILLFADLDIVSDIPAIVSTDSPVSQLIDEAVAETGGVVGDVLDVTGSLLGTVAEPINDIASSFELLPVCLNLEPMLDRNTVVLR